MLFLSCSHTRGGSSRRGAWIRCDLVGWEPLPLDQSKRSMPRSKRVFKFWDSKGRCLWLRRPKARGEAFGEKRDIVSWPLEDGILRTV